MEPLARLTVPDAAIVGGYLLLVVAITGGVSLARCRTAARSGAARKQPGVAAHPDEAHEFFLAKEAVSWWAVALSFFASNIGTDAIIGLSSAGATVGIVAGSFDFASSLAFLLLAYVFLPVYRASGVLTLPEFAARRFPGPLRVYLSVVSLIMYSLIKISIALFCGAILLEAVLGISGAAAVSGLLLLTTAFSLGGGMAAVIWVESLNAAVLLAGGTAAAVLALRAVGGWAGLVAAIASRSDAALAAGLTPAFSHLRQTSGVYALPALLLGAPWPILFFHACDQEMVQRGLAARSLPDARLGSVLAGLLKLCVPWLFCVPGIISRLLYPRELGCPAASPSPSAPGGGPCTRANLAYPALMLGLLPPGLLGVMLAAALAGVMSVLASTFNSGATLFASDVYRRCRPRASPVQLVWAGRLWIVVMAAAAVLWLPLLSRISPSLYVAMQLLNSALAPPIVAVFAAAVAWPRANATGALCCLLVGHAAGVLRLVLGAVLPEGSRELDAADPVLRMLASANFLSYSAVVGAASIVALVVGSLLTPPPPACDVDACTHPVVLALRARLRRSGGGGGPGGEPDAAAPPPAVGSGDGFSSCPLEDPAACASAGDPEGLSVTSEWAPRARHEEAATAALLSARDTGAGVAPLSSAWAQRAAPPAASAPATHAVGAAAADDADDRGRAAAAAAAAASDWFAHRWHLDWFAHALSLLLLMACAGSVAYVW